MFKSGQISKEQFKLVARKTVARLKHEHSGDVQHWLVPKRRAKIQDLIHKMIAQKL